MNPWWNLPFVLFVALAVWSRVGAPRRLLGAVGALFGFFGVVDAPVRRATADLFGIAGISGLLFVAWGQGLAAAPDALLLVDAVLSSLGLGLCGAWLLARLDPERMAETTEPGPGSLTRDMTMMEVDEIPRRAPMGGAGSGPVPDGSSSDQS